jgi:hypothetical protein
MGWEGVCGVYWMMLNLDLGEKGPERYLWDLGGKALDLY